VDTAFYGKNQLGADAIGTGDQNRVFVACLGNIKQRSKPAKVGNNTGTGGFRCKRTDPPNQFIAGIDIDPGILVTQPGCGFCILNVGWFGNGLSPWR
jgi:hypothetical protein